MKKYGEKISIQLPLAIPSVSDSYIYSNPTQNELIKKPTAVTVNGSKKYNKGSYNMGLWLSKNIFFQFMYLCT